MVIELSNKHDRVTKQVEKFHKMFGGSLVVFGASSFIYGIYYRYKAGMEKTDKNSTQWIVSYNNSEDKLEINFNPKRIVFCLGNGVAFASLAIVAYTFYTKNTF